MLSVINVLMQLRKVCNHPNLFEPRPTISPFQMEALTYTVPRSIFNIMEYDPYNVSNNKFQASKCLLSYKWFFFFTL